MIYDEFIDNMEVKTKTTKRWETSICFPTMKESKSHKLRTQRSCDMIKRHQDENIFFQKADRSITSQKSKLVKAQGQRKALNPNR